METRLRCFCRRASAETGPSCVPFGPLEAGRNRSMRPFSPWSPILGAELEHLPLGPGALSLVPYPRTPASHGGVASVRLGTWQLALGQSGQSQSAPSIRVAISCTQGQHLGGASPPKPHLLLLPGIFAAVLHQPSPGPEANVRQTLCPGRFLPVLASCKWLASCSRPASCRIGKLMSDNML